MPAYSPESGALGRILLRGLDLLLPPRCLGCGRLVETAHSLCADCWQGVAFLAPPVCARCGYPFEIEAGDGALCAACSREPPPWDRARAVFRYDDRSRGMILGFKYGDRTEAAKAFGQWLARAGRELLAEGDLLVPVPLHWTRLFSRRYNQAALLAHAVSKLSGVPADATVLVRNRRTPPQGGLDRTMRRRNVRGAFAVPVRKQARVARRRIVLIDDVLTTGSTVGACVEALREAGAASVDVLTLARVAAPRP
ncbi:MAG TPA: ComF family protein [Alphaproteobacteria bacterium]|nr:ComF family protein [Alphaproteobacteria bacterium]